MTSMTREQQSELERAVERADRLGIQVVAKGRRKRDNARIYCTNSHSDAGRWHIVAVEGAHLRCDCPSRVICCHRGAVHVALANEAAKKLRQADAIEAALEDEAMVREHAVLYRDNAAISLYK